MATKPSSVLRQWTMLRAIPRAPSKIAVRELCANLAAADFEVTSRTVQRDLVELSGVFPLIADEREKPYGWSWQRDAPGFDLPGLSIPDAVTLTLVQQHLHNQLPPSTLDALQPHFKSAAKALAAAGSTGTAKAWLQKVRTVAQSQPLGAPKIDEKCQRTIYMALMKDLQLTLDYKKRDALEVSTYEVVNPLAIVQRGGLLYLVCTFAAYDDVRTLAMHRVKRAAVRFEPARRPNRFDLDDYIASGALGFRTGAPVVLRATFSRAAGEHLFETPLSPDQVITVTEDDRLELTATVPATKTLVFWLCGFGPGVVVHGPPKLRAEIKKIALGMAAAYC